MYIVIFEDGEMQSTRDLGDDIIQGAEDGLLDLLDVSDSDNPMRWWDGEWQAVDAMRH